MKKIQIEIPLIEYENVNELELIDYNLLQKAAEIRNNAYAPYSNFKVGVALLLENNQIIVGTNQENAAYPSGLCAERVAIFQAGTLYPESRIVKMAIVAGSTTSKTQTPIPPCGACRQSIFEYEFKQETPIELFFMGETGKVLKSNSIKNLLPLSFDKNFL